MLELAHLNFELVLVLTVWLDFVAVFDHEEVEFVEIGFDINTLVKRIFILADQDEVVVEFNAATLA